MVETSVLGLIGDVHCEDNLVINGHSHYRMVRQHGSLTIINAGTLRRDHNPCFAAIDFDQKLVRFWDILDYQTAVPCGDIPLR